MLLCNLVYCYILLWVKKNNLNNYLSLVKVWFKLIKEQITKWSIKRWHLCQEKKKKPFQFSRFFWYSTHFLKIERYVMVVLTPVLLPLSHTVTFRRPPPTSPVRALRKMGPLSSLTEIDFNPLAHESKLSIPWQAVGLFPKFQWSWGKFVSCIARIFVSIPLRRLNKDYLWITVKIVDSATA